MALGRTLVALSLASVAASIALGVAVGWICGLALYAASIAVLGLVLLRAARKTRAASGQSHHGAGDAADYPASTQPNNMVRPRS